MWKCQWLVCIWSQQDLEKRVDLLSNLELSQSACMTRILLRRLVNLVKAEGWLQFDNTYLLVCTEPHKGHKFKEALPHLTRFANVGCYDCIALRVKLKRKPGNWLVIFDQLLIVLAARFSVTTLICLDKTNQLCGTRLLHFVSYITFCVARMLSY